MTVEGQGGDPRNAAPPATSKKPTNRPSKADVIKARVIEVIDLCKTGKNSKAASYFDDQLEVDGECVNIKEETQNGYYFGKFKTATAKDGREAFGWEVYYRGVTLPNGEISYPRNKGDVWYFLFVNGKYVLADFDDIERQEMSRPEATTLLNDVKPQNPNIELVRIRSGSFIMGSTDGESSEQPAHKIVINYSFYMGKHEVTQAQWQKVMGNNPSKFKDCDNCPVEQVSWDDAKIFIEKLNEINDGYKYRLPTEAEWEYAYRAGMTGNYAGDMKEIAWYIENSETRTHPVGSKQANAWGLADMNGNVWEWCEDWYHDTYNGAPRDGRAWLSGGEQKSRVIRGASWYGSAADLRPARRAEAPQNNRTFGVGFRVVAVTRTR